MRILHVVTLISPDGSYGGPTQVALNQSAELLARGHDVTVAAATRGYPVTPNTVNGVPVRLFRPRTLVPRTGFPGLYAPGLHSWFHRVGPSFDVVHIHLARDLVVMSVAASARRRRIPYTVQTHGMVVPSRHPAAPAVDTLWTRKVLRAAGAVFFLTPQERSQLAAISGTELRLVQLGNGVPDYEATTSRAAPQLPEVLFVARMHARKRPLTFVEMARRLLDAGIDAKFTLIGPDAGEGAALRRALQNESRIVWEGPLEPSAVRTRMAAASVYVLPSVREPYPMAVLEAMSVGLPVIVTEDCGLAPLIVGSRSGIVVDPTVVSLAAAVRTVLTDRGTAKGMGERGREVTRHEFNMRAIGDRLEGAYADVIDRRS
jgi:glycosyltransferase involved in cell wall biosynthesis